MPAVVVLDVVDAPQALREGLPVALLAVPPLHRLEPAMGAARTGRCLAGGTELVRGRRDRDQEDREDERVEVDRRRGHGHRPDIGRARRGWTPADVRRSAPHPILTPMLDPPASRALVAAPARGCVGLATRACVALATRACVA